MTEDRFDPLCGPLGGFTISENYTIYRTEPYLVYKMRQVERVLSPEEQQKLLASVKKITKGRVEVRIPPIQTIYKK